MRLSLCSVYNEVSLNTKLFSIEYLSTSTQKIYASYCFTVI